MQAQDPSWHPMADTLQQLEGIFARHARVCLWASAGKDSTALLHMLRPWCDRVTILHNQIDDGWPGSTDNLFACALQWGFLALTVTHPHVTLDEYFAQYGYPVDVVPTNSDTVIQPPSPYATGALRVSSWWHCTLLRQIFPLVEATQQLGMDVVLTGSRASDAPAFARMGHYTEHGKEGLGFVRYNPLAHWSPEEVYAYIDVHQIPLPSHYQWKRRIGDQYEVPDCMRCTWQPEHWNVLREHYPEVYHAHWPTVKKVYETLALKQWDYTTRIMRTVLKGEADGRPI